MVLEDPTVPNEAGDASIIVDPFNNGGEGGNNYLNTAAVSSPNGNNGAGNNNNNNYSSPTYSGNGASAGYSFQGKPKPISTSPSVKGGGSRANYNQGNGASNTGGSGGDDNRPVNIMHDKRVYRGNTYASPVMPSNAQAVDPVEAFRQQEMKRRSVAKKRSELQKRPRTPDAVPGRKHADIQTELYLEELANKIPESSNATQTDDFLDRAPSPFFVPQKSGLDASTQIEKGELFDFDLEVEPILQVIVGKTLEQASMEVMEELELEILKNHQEEYERKRTAEVVETQRLEEAERRRTEEKARRLLDEQRAFQRSQMAAEKLAARSFTQSYLSNLMNNVFGSLKEYGYVKDDVEENVLVGFVPWLTGRVQDTLNQQRIARFVVDEIILQSLRRSS